MYLVVAMSVYQTNVIRLVVAVISVYVVDFEDFISDEIISTNFTSAFLFSD